MHANPKNIEKFMMKHRLFEILNCNKRLLIVLHSIICLTLCTNVSAQQFIRYKCAAKGENGEMVIATRDTVNTTRLKESEFTLLVDFDKNSIEFLDSTAYPFKARLNPIMEETTPDQYFFKSYETEGQISQDIKIYRSSGNFYFSRTWGLNSTTYKFIELRGTCKTLEEKLHFRAIKRKGNEPLKFGDVVIPPQFSIAWDFSEGLASVWARDGGVERAGAIDQSGELKIPLIFSLLRGFKSGYAGACTHGSAKNCGFISKDGRWVIDPAYDEVWDFSDGFATVGIGERRSELNTTTGKVSEAPQKTAYVNTRGEIIGNKFFDQAYGFSEGLGSFARGSDRENRLWGFIDRSGNEVIPPKFGPGITSAVGEFRDGLASALVGHWRDGKYGYIDRSGKIVIPPIYQQAKPFHEGKAMVCRDAKQTNNGEAEKKSRFNFLSNDKTECSFINRDGKVLFPFKEYYYGNFNDGMATACRRDTYLNFSSQSCGYIDSKGVSVISEKFIMAEDFKNGYAKVSVSSKPKLWGLINRKGEFVVKPIYSDLGNVSEGFLAFRVGDDYSGKWGYLWAK